MNFNAPPHNPPSAHLTGQENSDKKYWEKLQIKESESLSFTTLIIEEMSF